MKFRRFNKFFGKLLSYLGVIVAFYGIERHLDLILAIGTAIVIIGCTLHEFSESD